MRPTTLCRTDQRFMIRLVRVLSICLVLFPNHIRTQPVSSKPLFWNDFQGRQPEDSSIRLVFYNCENLFDHRDDPGKGDKEFCQGGSRDWGFWRHREKLISIARVLIHCGEWDPPDLIGLAEIENRRVLQDLIRISPLVNIPYGILHFESLDPRGIDVALLYRKDRIMPIFSQAIRHNSAQHGISNTRDILYSKILIHRRDTLHVFINHWPSRFGGHLQTIPKRLAVAKHLAAYTDSLLIEDKGRGIVVCGDFNDEPHDTSLLVLTQRKTPGTSLVNLMKPLSKVPGTGSHKHAGNWGYLDQILVSESLLDASHSPKWVVQDGRAWLLEALYLLTKEEKGTGYRPYRSFAGTYYQRGFSDHLPVFIQLTRTPGHEVSQNLIQPSSESQKKHYLSNKNTGKRNNPLRGR